MRGTGCSGGAFDLFGLPVGLRRLRRGADRGVATVGPAPQGRHGRDLLLGLLAARRGGHRSPGPGRHHAAEPHRRPVLDRLSRAGSTTTGSPRAGSPQRVVGRRAGAAGRPALGGGGDRHRGHDLPGQPAPARAGREPRVAREPRTWPGRRRCSTSARPRCGPRTSRCPCSWSARSRTKRWDPSGPPSITALRPGQERLRHDDERDPHRLARSRHDLALAGVPRHLRRGPRAEPEPDPHRARARSCTRTLTAGRSPWRPPPCASRPSPRSRRREPPSPRRTRASGCSSTTAAAASAPEPCSPPTKPGFSPWPPAGTTVRVPPRSRGIPRHAAPARLRPPSSFRPDPAVRPADDLPSSGNAVGRPAALRLDDRPRGERGRLRDPGLHQGDDDRRPGQPRPAARGRRRPPPTCRSP